MDQPVNRDTAIVIIHRIYMNNVGSTLTIDELTDVLVNALVRRGYTKSYAVRIVNEYLDS